MSGLRGWQLFMLIAALTAAGYFAAGRLGERLRWPLVISWILLYPAVILIIRGFGGALPVVGTNLWGGLMLTLLLSTSGTPRISSM